jgi:hypothetical protein
MTQTLYAHMNKGNNNNNNKRHKPTAWFTGVVVTMKGIAHTHSR